MIESRKGRHEIYIQFANDNIVSDRRGRYSSSANILSLTHHVTTAEASSSSVGDQLLYVIYLYYTTWKYKVTLRT